MRLVIRTNNRWCHRVDIQRNLSDSRNEIPRRNRAPATDLRGLRVFLIHVQRYRTFSSPLPLSLTACYRPFQLEIYSRRLLTTLLTKIPRILFPTRQRFRSTILKLVARRNVDQPEQPIVRPHYVGKILDTDTKRILNTPGQTIDFKL